MLYKNSLFVFLSFFSFVTLNSVERVSDDTLRVIRCPQHLFRGPSSCVDCRERKEKAVAQNIFARIRELRIADSVNREQMGAEQIASIVRGELDGENVDVAPLLARFSEEGEIDALIKEIAKVRVRRLR